MMTEECFIEDEQDACSFFESVAQRWEKGGGQGSLRRRAGGSG